MKVLIFGASGMLGHKLLNYFVDNTEYEVVGTVRDINSLPIKFLEKYKKNIINNINAFDFNSLHVVIAKNKPHVIINAIGSIKQKKENQLNNIILNSTIPHILNNYAKENESKLITIGTDCIFKGNIPETEEYYDDSESDCIDTYGKSKYLGEIHGDENTLTIRTSIIGHELKTNNSLIDWFLMQNGEINGFKKAFYTGFPTVILAKIIHRIISDFPNLNGLYNVSSNPISKYELLQIVKNIYGKDIKINENSDFYMNRKLNSNIFKKITMMDFCDWEKMIGEMHTDYINNNFYRESNV